MGLVLLQTMCAYTRDYGYGPRYGNPRYSNPVYSKYAGDNGRGKLTLEVTVPFEAKFVLQNTNPNTGVVEGETIPEDIGNSYESWKASTNPTIPTVKGSAAIVLCPAAQKNWIQNIKKGDTLQSLLKSAGNDTIVDGGFENYTVREATMEIVPLYTAVLPDQVEDWEEKAHLKSAEKIKASGGLPKAEPIKRQLRKGPSSQNQNQNDSRNPSITSGNQVVFGTVINHEDLPDDGPGGPGSSPLNPIYSALPASFNGVIPWLVTFVPNAAQTWKATRIDLTSGPMTWSGTNIDFRQHYSQTMLKPTRVGPTIAEAQYEMNKEWVIVPVSDPTITWGSYVVTVMEGYEDAVTEVIQRTTTDESGTPVTLWYASFKSTIRGTITYIVDLFLQ